MTEPLHKGTIWPGLLAFVLITGAGAAIVHALTGWGVVALAAIWGSFAGWSLFALEKPHGR